MNALKLYFRTTHINIFKHFHARSAHKYMGKTILNWNELMNGLERHAGELSVIQLVTWSQHF